MPKHVVQQSLSASDLSINMANAYGSFLQLGWPVKFAGENVLVGFTPKSWNKNSLQITVSIEGGTMIVESQMISGEYFDISGKNKKNTAAFISQFNMLESNSGSADRDDWSREIARLQQETIVAAHEEQQTATEIDKAMNLSGGNMYASYVIMIINLLVFILMTVAGANIFQGDGLLAIKWGSNFAALTTTGDWWRLLTCTFVHFGVIHLAMNMYALYMVGVYLEPMLGKLKFVSAYLCTGIFASLVSLWWHNDGVNSAGASGAVFGMYGLFLALLLSKLIPAAIRKSLLQSIGLFVLYNLAYGIKSGVDNAAHIGGLLSGLVIGFLFIPAIRKDREGGQMLLPVFVVLAAVIGISYFYLEQNEGSVEEREKVLTELKNSSFKDAEEYDALYNKYVIVQKRALAPLEDTSLSNEASRQGIISVSVPAWKEADAILAKMQQLDVSDISHQKTKLLIQYNALREREAEVISRYLLNQDAAIVEEINHVRDSIGTVMEAFTKLQ